MITDGYWRGELYKSIKKLQFLKILSKTRLEIFKHKMSRTILYSAVIVRKIIEDALSAKKEIGSKAMKVPEFEVLRAEIAVIQIPYIGDDGLPMPKVHVDDYDWKKQKEKSVLIKEVCNSIIHSYVWNIFYDREYKKLAGFLVASDFDKEKFIYMITLDEWLKCLEYCVENCTI